MATYKRRIVYLSDEEWSALLNESKVREQSASSLIRAWLRDGIDYGTLQAQKPPTPVSTTQSRRDELLGKINRSR